MKRGYHIYRNSIYWTYVGVLLKQDNNIAHDIAAVCWSENIRFRSQMLFSTCQQSNSCAPSGGQNW